MYAKIKSEETNLAIPRKESYLQESIVYLQQIHGGKTPHNHNKKNPALFLTPGKGSQPVSLEDLVYLLFSKEKKLK